MRVGGSLVRFLVAALLLLGVTAPAAADTILAIPFENKARTADLDWVGESFAEALTERLDGFGHLVVQREQRLAALERLGLPAGVPVTRASLLRLAEEAGADWLVWGRFEVDESRTLRARAQLLDLHNLATPPPLDVRGPFARLLEIQGQLAWEILRRLDPAFSLGSEAFQQRFPRWRVSAFESYVRGLLAFNREQQVRYFLQAARLEPDYAAPAFRLAQLYFEDQDYSTAARWFEKIPADDPLALDARFYQALSRFFAHDYAGAVSTLAPVAERIPVAPLWNNLGVFASRQGDEQAALHYFARARQDDPGDPDLHFNLALHHLRRQQWQPAADALEHCIRLNPDDTEGHFLHALALERLGRTQEAEAARLQAVGDNPALLLSLERRQLDLDRLYPHFNARQLFLDADSKRAPGYAPARARHAAMHIRRGEDLLARSQLEPAQREFTQAILLDPDSYRAHLLLAEIYRRQERLPDAIAELQASLWSRDTLPARLRLAEIYLAQDRLDAAREQVHAALALDPDNDAARALARRLTTSSAQTLPEEARPQ
ncbi:MAG: tetratricopeptide repeat protein [Terriglobia bacterium]